MISGPLDSTLRTIEAEIGAIRQQQHALRFLLHQTEKINWGEEQSYDGNLESPKISKLSKRNEFFSKPASSMTSPATGHNPVTKAIVDKIIEKYGSMEQYHHTRRQRFGQSKLNSIITREEEQLKECTFKPAITRFSGVDKSGKKVDGIDTFLKRQEKAREMQCMQKAPKAGSGKVYTGQVTRPVPFSFSKQDVKTFPYQLRE